MYALHTHMCDVHCVGLLDADTDVEATPPVPGSLQTRLTFVAGVISRERMPVFERVLWRACRGNVFLRQAEILEPLEDPTTVRGGGRGEDEGVRWRSQWGCEGVRVCDMGGEGPSLPLSLRASWCSR